MKKAISLILVLVLAVGLMIPVSAATRTENVDITYRAIKIKLNGEEITPCDEGGKPLSPLL